MVGEITLKTNIMKKIKFTVSIISGRHYFTIDIDSKPAHLAFFIPSVWIPNSIVYDGGAKSEPSIHIYRNGNFSCMGVLVDHDPVSRDEADQLFFADPESDSVQYHARESFSKLFSFRENRAGEKDHVRWIRPEKLALGDTLELHLSYIQYHAVWELIQKRPRAFEDDTMIILAPL